MDDQESTDVHQDPESVFTELQDDLIEHYRINESSIPVSPLAEEHDTSLNKLYIKPPLKIACTSQQGSQEMINDKSCDGKIISSYSELLFGENAKQRNSVYITGNAGMGKTSFCKHLTMTWCNAHNPGHFIDKSFDRSDIDALKKFDLLFLTHLREFSSCDLDTILWDFVSNRLSRSHKYSNTTLKDLLHNKRCLVILDGIDEWVHPKTCRRDEKTPHERVRKHCTVLTTSRPWKFSVLALSSAHVDIHVELADLSTSMLHKLESRALAILKQARPREKDLVDFRNKLSDSKLSNVRLNPYIDLQLLALWFDNQNLGVSKCDIYINITEFTLERAFKKAQLVLKEGGAGAVPFCMEKTRYCKNQRDLLLLVGKVALSSQVSQEEMSGHTADKGMVKEKEIVKEHMSSSDLELVLKTGLLSQSKDNTKIHDVFHKVYFPDNSFQEFFAALYISETWDTPETQTVTAKLCTNVSDILKLSEVFALVCGMNPVVYTKISEKLASIIANDQMVKDYRKNMKWDQDVLTTVNSLQSAQITCYEENMKGNNDIHVNRNSSPDTSCVILHDFVLDIQRISENALVSVKHILEYNSNNARSLYIWCFSNEETERKASVLFPSKDRLKFRSLEMLRVEWNSEPHFLPHIITETTKTLRCMALYRVRIQLNFSELQPHQCLRHVTLFHVALTHNNMKKLFEYFGEETNIETLKMTHITCTDHRHTCNGLELNLKSLQKLISLHLDDVPNSELHVYPGALEDLTVVNSALSNNLSHENIKKLFDCINRARIIKKLALRSVSCFEHGSNCKNLVLNLSKHAVLSELKTQSIPVCEFYINCDVLQDCTIVFSSAGNGLSHENVKGIFHAISRGRMMRKLQLSCIKCSEHLNSCPDIVLDLHQFDKLETLALRQSPGVMVSELMDSYFRESNDKNAPVLRELKELKLIEISFDANGLKLSPSVSELESLELEKITMSSIQWKELFKSLDKCLVLKELKLREIDIEDIFPDFYPEFTYLRTIEFMMIKMTLTSWKDTFVSIGRLSQSLDVKLIMINMETEDWKELITETLRYLPQSVTLQFRYCKGPSVADWEVIVGELKNYFDLLCDPDVRPLGAWLTFVRKK